MRTDMTMNTNNSEDLIVIGIDHGFGNIKTANPCQNHNK